MLNRVLTNLPPIISGVPVTYGIAVVTPIARTNIAKNPSGETGSTGWALAGAATISRVTTRSCYGAYSFQVTPTSASGDGIYYDDSTNFGAGVNWAVSIALIGIPGQTYEISVRTTGGASLSARQWVASGYWERIWVSHVESIGTTRRVYVTKIGSGTGVFYVDGLNIELCGSEGVFPTTYIDGDQSGLIPNEAPPAYLWTGTPHASTSIRSGQTRAGGRLRSFSEFGFTLSALIGLGLAPPDHDLVPFSILDGAQYNDTRKPPRPFTFIGRFDGTSEADLRRNRGSLSRLLDRDLIARRQPLTLYLTPQDACNTPIGSTGRLTALYTGGLEGSHTNPFASEAPISFTTVQQSALQGSDAGSAITITEDSITQDHVLQRSAGHVWSRMGSGANFNGAVRALAVGVDGRVYAAGDFTSAAGGVAANRIAYFDPVTGAWNAMGTGAGATVRALAVGLDGSIYAAGDFTSMGGVANTSRIARWDGSAWNALSTGAAANEIYALTVGVDGNIYAGGTYTTIGGVAANRIAYWDGSAWNAMGTGANNTVRALATMLDGSIVAAGLFTDLGGVTDADRIGRWNGSAWVALGTGLNGNGLALAVGPDGRLYAGGAFTTAGGVSASLIAQWNGNQWQAMGGAFTGTDVQTLAFDRYANMLYVAGDFSSVDGLPQTFRYARWNGSNWIPGEMSVLSSFILAMLPRSDGSVVYGLETIGGFWRIPSLTTITNAGSAYTYPTFTYSGTGLAVYEAITIFNPTTGALLTFSLESIGSERITIVCDPTQFAITSSTRGLITGSVLLGSSVSNFALQPGTNVIAVLVRNGPTMAMRWPQLYLEMDDLVPVSS